VTAMWRNCSRYSIMVAEASEDTCG
jgi:hypothetical protein